MSNKNFQEYKNDLIANSKTRSFSRGEFNNLLTKLANDTSYEVGIVKLKADEPQVTQLSPSGELRKTLHRILLDFGVDAQDAQPMIDGNYSFKNLDGLYDFMAEAVETMAEARVFMLPSKEDMVGPGLQILTVEENTQVNKVVASPTGETRTVKTKKHRKAKVKSAKPKWLQETL